MTNRQYHGICVGGSMAGHYLTGKSPAYCCVKIDPGPLCYEKLCGESQITSTESERYLFHELPFHEGTFGFWIPADRSPFWALKELIETYAVYEDLK